MWSLNSNSILTSGCKQLDCKQRVAHRAGSWKWKLASSNRSPRIMGFAPRGWIAVCRKSDGKSSWWVLRLVGDSSFFVPELYHVILPPDGDKVKHSGFTQRCKGNMLLLCQRASWTWWSCWQLQLFLLTIPAVKWFLCKLTKNSISNCFLYNQIS